MEMQTEVHKPKRHFVTYLPHLVGFIVPAILAGAAIYLVWLLFTHQPTGYAMVDVGAMALVIMLVAVAPTAAAWFFLAVFQVISVEKASEKPKKIKVGMGFIFCKYILFVIGCLIGLVQVLLAVQGVSYNVPYNLQETLVTYAVLLVGLLILITAEVLLLIFYHSRFAVTQDTQFANELSTQTLPENMPTPDKSVKQIENEVKQRLKG